MPRTSREGALFLDAVAHAQEQTPEHPSIVNGSIAAAVRGEFGDVQFTSRTKGSELFVNPLMALYFAFELDGLAGRCLYLDRIENTHLMRQVSRAIEVFREGSGSARRAGSPTENAGTGVGWPESAVRFRGSWFGGRFRT